MGKVVEIGDVEGVQALDEGGVLDQLLELGCVEYVLLLLDEAAHS